MDIVEVKWWFLDAYWKCCPCWLMEEKTWVRDWSAYRQAIWGKKTRTHWIVGFLWKLCSIALSQTCSHWDQRKGQRIWILWGVSGLRSGKKGTVPTNCCQNLFLIGVPCRHWFGDFDPWRHLFGALGCFKRGFDRPGLCLRGIAISTGARCVSSPYSVMTS